MSSPAFAAVSGSAQWFTTTHWSIVLAAEQGDRPEAVAALENMGRTYWLPRYAIGRPDEDDLTEAQDPPCSRLTPERP